MAKRRQVTLTEKAYKKVLKLAFKEDTRRIGRIASALIMRDDGTADL